MKIISYLLLASTFLMGSCTSQPEINLAETAADIPFTWNSANIYFLLTDRFSNADQSNDLNFDRTAPTGPLRGFMGGDLKGITEKIREGYFTDLGINAIWMTPFFEQIKGAVNEGTGDTYAYHGYWTSDWTALDPNFGTEADLAELINVARKHDIRIVMDIILNHTGPVTPLDPVWPAEWVRTSPQCTYENYETTIECTLVENLPDIRTESETSVELPPMLIEKWAKEKRLNKELEELDRFFEETGYPRAPKYYIIKWITDYIREFGITAYRIDTAKHTEESVWGILRKQADNALLNFKQEHPGVIPEDESFYMVGEVYNYVISGGRLFNFGDTLVDFFAEGINHLINFEFKSDAHMEYEEIFSKYSDILNGVLDGHGVLNYISSHDDGWPFDKNRENPIDAATKLLLCPGASQVYYGDESSRLLYVENAVGDANLRSFMNWDAIKNNIDINGFKVHDVLTHYQKLGKFRANHPSVGAGVHQLISEEPYVFKRTYTIGSVKDAVVVGLNLPPGTKTIPVEGVFDDGVNVIDSYSGISTKVINGMVTLDSDSDIALLGLF